MSNIGQVFLVRVSVTQHSVYPQVSEYF